MNRKSLTIVVGLVVAAAAGAWWYRRESAAGAVTYRFASVERGALQSTVSATGSLDAVTTVQVGTQVSGQVAEIYADFNDRVKKGQLLARIDPTLLQQSVLDAQAVLERNVAERDQAQRENDRNKSLYERKVLTEVEYQTSQYKLAVAEASVKSARVSLERARRNLAYTEIYAPIDGVVVERNVDVGQTVAASLQAPQLFLIANDLSQMEILARVDESDIGAIHDGQAVRFTVQPYPNESFPGTVRQVRLQSTTQENVVNYTVVVSVRNESGRLLPGMTATVSFITGSVDDALIVPNAALRFRPTNAMLAASGIDTAGTAGANGGGPRGGASAEGRPASNTPAGATPTGATPTGATPGARDMRRNGGAPAAMDGAARPRTATRLWVLDADKRLHSISVDAGLSDGQKTVVAGQGLETGMQVVIGALTGNAAAPGAGGTSPFQSTQQRGPGGGGPRPPGF